MSLPECGLGANLWQASKCFLADCNPLDLRADLDDLQTIPTLVTQKHASRRCTSRKVTPSHSPASSLVACTAWCGLSGLCPANPEESHVESWCPLFPWWTTDYCKTSRFDTHVFRLTTVSLLNELPPDETPSSVRGKHDDGGDGAL